MSNRVENQPVVDGAGSLEPVQHTRRSLLAGIAKALFVAPAAVALVGIETNPGTAQDQEEVTDRPDRDGEDRPRRRRRRKGGGKKRRRRRRGGGKKRRPRREREIEVIERGNRGDGSCQARVGQVFCRGRDR